MRLRRYVIAMLKQGLGVADTAAVGDPVKLTPEGLSPIEGTVDYVSADFLGAHTDDAMYRFIRGCNDTAVLGHQPFANDVDGQEAERSWQVG